MMRFIKYFKLFLEKFTDNSHIGKWLISYNHNLNHDINQRILKRTDVKNEKEFNQILNRITRKIEDEKLTGDYVFVSFGYSIKIVSYIYMNTILVRTILGKKENIKVNDKIVFV
jgi:hydrogenase maturation factor